MDFSFSAIMLDNYNLVNNFSNFANSNDSDHYFNRNHGITLASFRICGLDSQLFF